MSLCRLNGGSYKKKLMPEWRGYIEVSLVATQLLVTVVVKCKT